MKKILLIIILAINALLWAGFSTLNYLGIYRQIRSEFMEAILWSLFVVIAYLLILCSASLVIARVYYIFRYRRIKAKFIDFGTLMKQIITLSAGIVYIYGVCYYNADFMGLIPAMLFFFKNFLKAGKLYVYHKGRLILMDEKSAEYIIKNIDYQNNKIIVEDIKDSSIKTIVLKHKKPRKEEEFLNFLSVTMSVTKEVA